MNSEEIRASWNRIAEPYQYKWNRRSDVVQYSAYVPDESQLRILGEVAGKRVLDLGCGGGQASVALALAGAKCIGVDISDTQIEFARQLAADQLVTGEFHCADMVSFLRGQAAASFDIALSVLGVPYVEDQRSLFGEIRRVLVLSGLFVFVTNHPLNDITCTEGGKTIVRRSYFDTGREVWMWQDAKSDANAPMETYCRTIGETVDDLRKSGLILERIVEPEAIAENVPLTDEDVGRYSLIQPDINWKTRAA
jgi:SAM-dependent methyltransferase